MSNLVFPAFAPPNFGWTWPVKKAPMFKTIIQTPASNRGEVRISLTPYPIWIFDYDISYVKGDMGVSSPLALQTFVGFFGAVQGAAQDWLFTDPYDHTATAMAFGTGDGVTTAFQLTRTIGAMTDLIQNVNGVPAVFINGTPVAGVNYSVTNMGIVNFVTAPPNTAILTWTGPFYFRCRFEEDTLADLDEFLYQIWECKSLKFRSVIL